MWVGTVESPYNIGVQHIVNMVGINCAWHIYPRAFGRGAVGRKARGVIMLYDFRTPWPPLCGGPFFLITQTWG